MVSIYTRGPESRNLFCFSKSTVLYLQPGHISFSLYGSNFGWYFWDMVVTILILNYNGQKWLEKFLPSVLATDYDKAKLDILVVDNASTDQSVDFLTRHFPAVRVTVLDKNYGFAGGNNRGVEKHLLPETEIVVLLNSDVEVPPDWLKPLTEEFEKNPKWGALQPKLLAQTQKTYFEYAGAAGGWIDSFGYAFGRGRIFDTLEEDKGQYDSAEPVPVFWATGACIAIRREVLTKIGLFEESFFAHYEEIDFCWRLQRAGWLVGVVSRSHVWHVGGGTLPQGNPRKVYLNFRNSLATLYKNLPMPAGLLTIFWRLMLDAPAALKELAGGKVANFMSIFKSHIAFYGMIGRLNKVRKKDQVADLPFSPLSRLKGTFNGSVVWQYFVRGKKTFSEIVRER
jgi:hypothetical protein